MNNRETARKVPRSEASPYAGDPDGEKGDRQRQREADELCRRPFPVNGRQRVFPGRDRGGFWFTHVTPLAYSENNKGPGLPRAFAARRSALAYFSEELIEVNLAFRLVPRPLTTAMIASEMPAGVRPYSMAVAPDSSFTKRVIRFFIGGSMCTRGWSN